MEENTGANTSTKQPRSQARASLRQFHEISSRRYAGDYGACDVLIDLQTAISRARLTDRQAQAISYIYGDGLTQAEAAGLMGVSRRNVTQLLAFGERRIDEIYDIWQLLDEEMAE